MVGEYCVSSVPFCNTTELAFSNSLSPSRSILGRMPSFLYVDGYPITSCSTQIHTSVTVDNLAEYFKVEVALKLRSMSLLCISIRRLCVAVMLLVDNLSSCDQLRVQDSFLYRLLRTSTLASLGELHPTA